MNISDTKLLRGERDQNCRQLFKRAFKRIPNCSVGSEIKTVCAGNWIAPPDTKLLRGERDQNGNGGGKTAANHDTKLLRGERDQNLILIITLFARKIPNCSVGSEIKTLFLEDCKDFARYQIAPLGARSKPSDRDERASAIIPRPSLPASASSDIPPAAIHSQTGPGPRPSPPAHCWSPRPSANL
jgi:hypothetical protein